MTPQRKPCKPLYDPTYIYRPTAEELRMIDLFFRRLSGSTTDASLDRPSGLSPEAEQFWSTLPHWQERFQAKDAPSFTAAYTASKTREVSEARKRIDELVLCRQANPTYFTSYPSALPPPTFTEDFRHRVHPLLEMFVDLEFGRLSGEARRKAEHLGGSSTDRQELMARIKRLRATAGHGTIYAFKAHIGDLLKAVGSADEPDSWVLGRDLDV